jgi:hypothetical protein
MMSPLFLPQLRTRVSNPLLLFRKQTANLSICPIGWSRTQFTLDIFGIALAPHTERGSLFLKPNLLKGDRDETKHSETFHLGISD